MRCWKDDGLANECRESGVCSLVEGDCQVRMGTEDETIERWQVQSIANNMRGSYINSLGRTIAVGHGLRRHGDCL